MTPSEPLIERVAGLVVERLTAEIARLDARRTWRRGRVTSFDLAATPQQVYVDVGASGTSVPMRFLARYAPTVNDQVMVVWEGGDPFVVDKLA